MGPSPPVKTYLNSQYITGCKSKADPFYSTFRKAYSLYIQQGAVLYCWIAIQIYDNSNLPSRGKPCPTAELTYPLTTQAVRRIMNLLDTIWVLKILAFILNKPGKALTTAIFSKRKHYCQERPRLHLLLPTTDLVL